MAQQEKTLFIPFAGGLDLYSNPHVLQPGMLTAATGIALNRPGYTYAGPGFVAAATSLGYTKQMNYGVSVYTQPNKLADQLLTWSTSDNFFDAGLGTVGVAQVGQPANVSPLNPWRQQVAHVYPGSGVKTSVSAGATMVSPPQMCGLQGGNFVYVWKTAGNTFAAIIYQNGTPTGPYNLTSTGWSMDPTKTPSAITGVKWVLVGNQTSFAVVWLDVSGNVQAFGSTYSFSTGGFTSVNGPFTDLDGCSPVSLNALNPAGTSTVVVRDNANTALKAISVAGTNGALGGAVTVISSLPAGSVAPIACCGLGPQDNINNSWVFATFNASTQLVIAGTNTSYSVQISKTLTSYGSYTAANMGTPVGLGVASTWGIDSSDLSIWSLGFAIEWKPSAQTPVTGTTSTYNSVLCMDVPNFGTGSPTNGLTSKLITGWGGIGLLGRPVKWLWQTVTDPVQGTQYRCEWVVPLRSGWRHNDGTWGTTTTAGVPMAYPNGYLYNVNGQLLGRFGDADVGTELMWPEFASASYAPQTLPILSGAVQGNLANGALTVMWCFPQLTDFTMLSNRSADLGAIIGARCGISTVTLEAPSLVEPVAAAQQMGNTLCIPGLLTTYHDGSRAVEAGFLHRSPTPWLALASGGAIPTSVQRYYQTVLAYTDKAGRVHYGAPSRLALSPATTAGNQQFTVSVPFCKQTLRNGLQPTQILIYASADNPGTGTNGSAITMYLISNAKLNNPEAISTTPTASDYYVTFTDATLTGTLTAFPTIYTSGMSAGAGIGNDAPPPFDCLTLWNNRLWGVANRNGPELWFTWPLDTAVLQPEAPAWSRNNRIPLPADIGQPRAIMGLDDKFLVLGTRADYGITGDGPPRTTTQVETGGFVTPIQLPTPGGIQVLNGVTRLPQGILFQAAQGFTLLDRSLTYQALGNPVNTYTDVAGNLYLPGIFNTANQCVMLFSVLGAQYDLMYFYGDGMWSQCEHPGVNATTDTSVILGSARVVNGTPSSVYVVPATGTNVYYVTQFSTYMSFRTPWIELGDSGSQYSPKGSVAGFGMLRELQLVGDPAGGGFTTTLFTEYDYAGNTAQPTETQTLSAVTADTQWRFGFANGNCRRVRLTVTINAGKRGTASQPPVYLAGLMLTYATDQGLSRLGSGNSI